MNKTIIIVTILFYTLLSIGCISTSASVQKRNEETERQKQLELENEISRLDSEIATLEFEEKMLETHFKLDGEWYQKDKFPKGITGLTSLKLGDENFVHNNPYGFDKTVAYYFDGGSGRVLQWLEDGCLYDFAALVASHVFWSCLSYVKIEPARRNSFFDKNLKKFFLYKGVVSYTTTLGGTNTVPVFEVILY